MWNAPEVAHGEKQRVYDEQRLFLGNYKTAPCKEEDLQKVIDKDSEEGLVSGPFAEAELRAKYPQVLLNSSGAEIKDTRKTRCQNTGRCDPRGRQSTHSSRNATHKAQSCGCVKDYAPSKATGRREMGRGFCQPTRHAAGIGTRPSPDYGTQRALLRRHRRNFRSCLGRPKLGPSRKRCSPAGPKAGRSERSAHLTISR